uniref:protein-serine/threonine phosphatase n=1 Tax=Parascaris univalens TaxID=6257 RepID=A0A914ZEC1_PARUN
FILRLVGWLEWTKMRHKTPKCDSTKLDKDNIETYMRTILEGIRDERKINQQMKEQQIVQILHRGADLFQKDPILLEFALPESGLVIVGNLDGEISDLLTVMRTLGFPPQKHYLFLGSYIDRENRGPYQMEVFIYLVLMKLRWPSYIYLLRGCQEVFDCNYECGFAELCNQTFRNNKIYGVFSGTFDVMPLAAIVGDSLLCCHGGISQWMTSRDNIRQMPRPTYRKNMKMLDRCLLTDILWAIPTRFQRIPFIPSPEIDAGFAFNEAALDAVMRALHVTTIVRSHQHRSGGFYEDFRGKCYTVYTVPYGINDRCFGAVLRLQRSVDGGMEITPIQHREKPSSSIVTLCERSILALQRAFESSVYDPPLSQDRCKHCEAKTSASLRNAFRLATHYDIGYWMRKNAKSYIEKNNEYKKIPAKFKELRATVLARLFPLYFDLTYLEAGTYRVLLSAEEWNTIREAHPQTVLNTTPVSIASSWHELGIIDAPVQQDGITVNEAISHNEEDEQVEGEDEGIERMISIGDDRVDNIDPVDIRRRASMGEPIPGTSTRQTSSQCTTYPIRHQSSDLSKRSDHKKASSGIQHFLSRSKERMLKQRKCIKRKKHWRPLFDTTNLSD